jgi:hypothetical protein
MKEKALLGAPAGHPVHQARVIIQRCSYGGLSLMIGSAANSLNFSKDGNSLVEAAVIPKNKKDFQEVHFAS